MEISKEKVVQLEQKVEDMDTDLKMVGERLQQLASRIHMTTLAIVGALLTSITIVWMITSAYYQDNKDEVTALEEQVLTLSHTASILGERVQQMITIIEIQTGTLSEENRRLLEDVKQIEKELHGHTGDNGSHTDG